ncbi:hypothetical protein H312_01378 [Anncaliia algerae PRA339]|uniref:Uncharacterized protein n=1 Tax=Anncaliia algerae PRA339 TaxID=1288291 RepID=A0A059F1L4_9MICR|nr:hypothetical protein H312_01378 [Anncaliia algerae PRA339]
MWGTLRYFCLNFKYIYHLEDWVCHSRFFNISYFFFSHLPLFLILLTLKFVIFVISLILFPDLHHVITSTFFSYREMNSGLYRLGQVLYMFFSQSLPIIPPKLNKKHFVPFFCTLKDKKRKKY